MKCYKPLTAYRTRDGAVFFYEKHKDAEQIKFRCGQCIGCKINRAHEWGIRIMHEAQLHDKKCFITLTYNEKNLPNNLSLDYTHFQRFLRNIRKKHKIRYYACGEYGEQNGRPHYHAALFGIDFSEDRYKWMTNGGNTLWRSATLERYWKLGTSSIGNLTLESAQYVAGYITTKKNGDGQNKYYNIFNITTGEILLREKEFGHMSLKPGIAKDWLRLYWKEIKDGEVTTMKGKSPIPKFYRQYLKNTQHYTHIIDNLQEKIKADDNTEKRLQEQELYTTTNLKERKHG